MKHLLSLIILVYTGLLSTIASQSVGINTTTPDPSAALHISDTQRGVLLPKMTSSQRESISNAAHGLLVFDTETNSFWWKDGSNWVELVSSQSGLRDTDADTYIQVEQTPDEDEITFQVDGAERGRFFGDQLHLNGKLSLGTTIKRGLMTLRGPNDAEFGPSLFMYGNSSDQVESGRIRFVESTSSSSWRGAYMHYDGSQNLLHLGMHNLSDKNTSNDFNAMTIKRSNGFIGINNQNPQQRLSVSGDVNFENNSQVNIKTDAGGVTISTANSIIEVNADGNIFISSPTGDIDMAAENINFNASNNFTIQAQSNLSLIADNDMNQSIGGDYNQLVDGTIDIIGSDDIAITSGETLSAEASEIDIDAAFNIAIKALNTSINSTLVTNIKGANILLNASSSSDGAARVNDPVNTPNSLTGKVLSGSLSVKIGG